MPRRRRLGVGPPTENAPAVFAVSAPGDRCMPGARILSETPTQDTSPDSSCPSHTDLEKPRSSATFAARLEFTFRVMIPPEAW